MKVVLYIASYLLMAVFITIMGGINNFGAVSGTATFLFFSLLGWFTSQIWEKSISSKDKTEDPPNLKKGVQANHSRGGVLVKVSAACLIISFLVWGSYQMVNARYQEGYNAGYEVGLDDGQKSASDNAVSRVDYFTETTQLQARVAVLEEICERHGINIEEDISDMVDEVSAKK